MKAITFLSVPIFTRIMSQNDYGLFSVCVTYINLFVIIIGLSLNTATINARIEYGRRFLDFNSTIIKASLITFLAESILMNLLYPVFSEFVKVNRFQLNLMLLISYSIYIVNSYYKINTVDFNFKANVILSASNSICSLLLAVFLLKHIELAVTAKLIGDYFFIIITSFVLFYFIGIKRSSAFKLKYIIYSIKFAIPNIFHQIAQIIMGQSDRIMILNFCNAATAAKYSVIHTYGLVLQMLWNTINEIWVPWLYRKLHRDEYETVKKVSGIYLMGFSFITALILLIAPDFLFLLAPGSYSNAKDLISPIILSTYFIFIYSFFVNLEIYHKKNKYMAIATVFAAGINIGSNYIFIPLFGYKAAAYTTLGSYIFLVIFHAVLSTYILHINFYSFFSFFKYIAAVTIISVLSGIWINIFYMRYIMVITLLLIAAYILKKNQKKIKEFIKDIKN